MTTRTATLRLTPGGAKLSVNIRHVIMREQASSKIARTNFHVRA